MRATDGRLRYDQKRAVGMDAGRRDGSSADPSVDDAAKAFEDWVGDLLGQPHDDELLLRGRSRPPYTVDLDGRRRTLKPYLILNSHGDYLIVEPDQPRRHADVYLVGRPAKRGGPWKLLGYIRHASLLRKPLVDFGYGPKLACHYRDLYPLADLRLRAPAPEQLALL